MQIFESSFFPDAITSWNNVIEMLLKYGAGLYFYNFIFCNEKK